MAAVVQVSKLARLIGHKIQARETTNAVNAFLGIPYAKPPLGDLRFQAPQPVELWEGVRNATQYGPICPQNMEASAKTHHPFPMPELVSEDCLYLNVWTPASEPTAAGSVKKKAVMFWIYGGSFVQGFSNYYDGTALAGNHDVVVVSINYRVGPLGFLSTGDGIVPGNAGLLDQLAALKWVRQHIIKFGGDPDNITVFGESAGAISTSFHLCSPLSRGLFRRAICQSGTALHPSSAWPQKNARRYLLKRLQAMGCQETDSNKMLSFLNNFSAEDLVAQLGDGFAPVVDNYFVRGEPADFYYNPIPDPKVDLMIGFNSHEGAQFIFALAQTKKLPNTEIAQALVDGMVCKAFFRGSPVSKDISKIVTEKYLKGADIMTGEQLTEAVADSYGDVLFVAPSVKTANIHSSRSPTYMYMFNYRLSLSSFPSWVTADHGNEIPLVFGEPSLARLSSKWSHKDKAMSSMIMTYWTNFAKTGNPNGIGLTQWPEYKSKDRKYLQLEGNPRALCDFEPDRMRLWNKNVETLVQTAKHKSKY